MAEIRYGQASLTERRGDLETARRLSRKSLALSEPISYHISIPLQTFLTRLDRMKSNRRVVCSMNGFGLLGDHEPG